MSQQAQEETFLVRNGSLRIAAKRWGPANGYPILALHGWLDNANTWDELVPKVMSQHDGPLQVVAPDFAGHGRSEYRHVTTDYGPNKFVADILMVVEQLGWSSFALLGHSMGGAMATLVAGLLKTRITHMILIDNLGPPFPPSSAADFAKFWAQSLKVQALPTKPSKLLPSLEACVRVRASGTEDMTMSIEAARTLMGRGAEAVSSPDGATIQYRFTVDPRVRFIHFDLEIPGNVVDHFLASTKCPVLVLMGQNGAPYAKTMVEERAKLVKTLRVVTVKGYHHPHLDVGVDECVAETLKWLSDYPLVPAAASAGTQRTLRSASISAKPKNKL
ncbi:Alpha/Beta hydrolase protein [Fimicolochytrium jonesii]|uniref:Alpha/Beta hydrolase protein n=1 Tax=Fimicolochytrium jonesii TaxID=1396493 RepID=UPI0022FDB4ED|nr:Alpha/Beta hydrolase protein [Fimicolochytrium jonesii]KAI8818101.1 Alpha/Beta hydrolase protein [Fimicolochytrium jonesii]